MYIVSQILNTISNPIKCMVNYGTPEQPNLEEISKELLIPLKKYNGLLMREATAYLDGEPLLQLTPEKPNTARVVLDVMIEGNKVGDLYIILFSPGDGTGAAGDYSLDQFARIPSKYRFETKPERILPRNKLKEGVLCEAFLPLFSVEEYHYFPSIISLEEITVDNIQKPKQLVHGLDLGFPGFSKTNRRYKGQPLIQLTTGYRYDGQRFGDPHATFYNPQQAVGRPNLMHVAGFLAIEDAANPLSKMLDRIAIIPE